MHVAHVMHVTSLVPVIVHCMHRHVLQHVAKQQRDHA